MYLFKRKHTYHGPEPVDETHRLLRRIITRRFDDFSVDVIGGLGPDGSFALTHKWGIIKTKWPENRPAYLKGRLQPKEKDTMIEVTIRPNIMLISLFYVFGFIFLFELSGMENFIPCPWLLKVSIPLVINMVIFMMITSSISGLRKRFERQMRLGKGGPVLRIVA